jgi:hypothetical protein
LTDAKLGVKAVLKKAKEIPDAWYCDQFDNLANQRVRAGCGGAPCLLNRDGGRIFILAKALSLMWPNNCLGMFGVLGFGVLGNSIRRFDRFGKRVFLGQSSRISSQCGKDLWPLWTKYLVWSDDQLMPKVFASMVHPVSYW